MADPNGHRSTRRTSFRFRPESTIVEYIFGIHAMRIIRVKIDDPKSIQNIVNSDKVLPTFGSFSVGSGSGASFGSFKISIRIDWFSFSTE
jgi:hypothetical protein